MFYWTRKVENFHGINCIFLHWNPILLLHKTCLQSKISKHSQKTKSWHFQTSPYQRLKSNFRLSHLIPIFLGLMCYSKIRKDENKLNTIGLTLYSWSDYDLGENSLQLVVKMWTDPYPNKCMYPFKWYLSFRSSQWVTIGDCWQTYKPTSQKTVAQQNRSWTQQHIAHGLMSWPLWLPIQWQ